MIRPRSHRFARVGLVTASLLLLLGVALLAWGASPAQASAAPDLRPSEGQPAPQEQSNAECLLCHGKPGQAVTLPSGEPLAITIDPGVFGASAHGQANQNCTACHANITGFPHPARTAESLRAYSEQYQQTCTNCHQEQHADYGEGIHGQAREEGDPNAPLCTDCHNPHAQKALNDEAGVPLATVRADAARTCAKCHNGIFEEYAMSVHGENLLARNNPDTPTCVDCHSAHKIEDPTTVAFRVGSVELCGSCHTNGEIMDHYGLSTNVLNSYVADFHGTTITLFDPNQTGADTNKPVCTDCHGVHDIRRKDDPVKGLQVKENLMVTCQRCHPNASENFPDSWLGHYIPDRDRYPVVYYVELFYKFFIPTVLGGMAFYVLTDIFWRVRNRRKPALVAAATTVEPQDDSGDTGPEPEPVASAPVQPGVEDTTDLAGTEEKEG